MAATHNGAPIGISLFKNSGVHNLISLHYILSIIVEYLKKIPKIALYASKGTGNCHLVYLLILKMFPEKLKSSKDLATESRGKPKS